MLGYLEHLALTETRITLGPDDTLLLYTDGLTEFPESRSAPASLHDWLRAAQADTLEALLTQLETLAVSAAEGRPRDDIAMLALQALSEKTSGR